MDRRKSIVITFITLVVSIGLFITQDQSETIDESSPIGRDEWRAQRRARTDTPAKVMKAKSLFGQRLAKSTMLKDGGLSSWTQLDIHEEGGRVRALAVHPTDPDILYCGAASGGIWKSTNGGASWSPLNDFLPSLSIGTILIDPLHPDTLYASTGETVTANNDPNNSTPGAGIFRSFDGGDSWELVPALSGDDFDDFYWVQSIAFDSADPSVFYAGKNGTKTSVNSGDGEVWKFENYGATKTLLYTAPLLGRIYHIVVNPGDKDNIFICTENGLRYTVDGGNSWPDAGFGVSSGRVEVAVAPSNPNVVYALLQGSATGTIKISYNKGLSWSDVLTGLSIFSTTRGNLGWYANVIWVDPLDANQIVVGGIDLYRYRIGETNLTPISDHDQNDLGSSAHADQHVIVAASDYSGANKRIYVGNDGGIAALSNYSTVTTTSEWELLNNGLHITQYYDSDIDGANPQRIIAGAQDNGTVYTDDSGATWSKVAYSDGGYCAISRQDERLQYASSQYGDFEIKHGNLNLFAPYFDLEDEQGSPAPFIAPMAMNPTDGRQIIVGGERVYHIAFDTSTLQKTVTDITPDNPPNSFYEVSSIAISEDGFMTLVGYSDGSLWRYLGDSVTIAPAIKIYQHPVDRPITSIAIHPNISDRIAISIGGYVDDNVIIGLNVMRLILSQIEWEIRDNGIANIHVNDLVWHPTKNSWLYAATDLGIMATEDNGNNWNVSPNFMNVSDGPVFTEVSKLQFTQQKTLGGHELVATTYGRGIWISDDIIRTDMWVDEDAPGPVENGLFSSPFQDIESAADQQANGQTWHIDAGAYPTDGPVIITKRVGNVLKTGEGAVIIGDN